jgi:hypothetical protein
MKKRLYMTCHSAQLLTRWRVENVERRSFWLEERVNALAALLQGRDPGDSSDQSSKTGNGSWGLPPDYVVPVPVQYPALRIFTGLIVLSVVAIAATRIFWRGLLNLPFLLMTVSTLAAILLNIYIFEKFIRPRLRAAVSAARHYLVVLLLQALPLLMFLLMYWVIFK